MTELAQGLTSSQAEFGTFPTGSTRDKIGRVLLGFHINLFAAQISNGRSLEVTSNLMQVAMTEMDEEADVSNSFISYVPHEVLYKNAVTYISSNFNSLKICRSLQLNSRTRRSTILPSVGLFSQRKISFTKEK